MVNSNGNGTQHQLLFRVPNTPYGRAFIEWSKSFLNTDSYRLKVRGRDGVGVQEANHLSGRQQFYQDAYAMKTALNSIGI